MIAKDHARKLSSAAGSCVQVRASGPTSRQDCIREEADMSNKSRLDLYSVEGIMSTVRAIKHRPVLSRQQRSAAFWYGTSTRTVIRDDQKRKYLTDSRYE